MIRITSIILLSVGLLCCSSGDSETTSSTYEQRETKSPADSAEIRYPLENFNLIEDFERDKSIFRSDTFDLNGYSTDGGQLIAYHMKDKDYLVLDVWIFGETGKMHSTYWTDDEFNLKIVKRTDFVYDRPYYVEGYKITETTEFYSYSDSTFTRYNSDKREINTVDNVENEVRVKGLFTEIVKEIEIVK